MDFSRQKEIFVPENFSLPVHVIGAGATGSWLTLFLAKMGITNITVYDFDKVEEHNLPNQLYRDGMQGGGNISDVSILKPMALGHIVKQFTGTDIKVSYERVTGDTETLNGVVFILTDSMKSRKEIFDRAIKMKYGTNLLIETRMDLEEGRIYTINPINSKHITEYEKTLYSDDTAAVSACGASRSIVSTAALIASYAVWQLINFHNDVEIDNEIIFNIKHNSLMTRRFGNSWA